MAAMEMGTYPFACEAKQLMSQEPDIEERVQTSYGLVKVSIYGDRKKHPVVTFHDIGLDSENNFQNFFQFGTVTDFTERFCVYNINAPGQEMDAQPLADGFVFPTMEGMARIVETVVDHFNLKSFIGFGVGAGANVMLRYALEHQMKLDALLLVNCVATTAGWIEWGYQKVNMKYLRSQGMTNFTVDYLMWHHFGKRLDECNPDIVRQYRAYFQHHPNPGNLAAFIEAYLSRTPIHLSRDGSAGPHLKVPVLQIVGSRSAFIEESVDVNTKLDPSSSEWIKVSEACGLVLDDRPERVTEAMLLFLQGLGYFPSLNVINIMRKINDAQNGIVHTDDVLPYTSAVTAETTDAY